MAFKSSKPALATICKDHNQARRLDAILHIQLVALSRFLNLKQGFTEEHVDYIVDKILHDESYRWFKMPDIAIVIDRIKRGYYGSFYENLNATKFLEILSDYDSERTLAIEQTRIEEANAAKDTNRIAATAMMEQLYEITKMKIIEEEEAKERNRVRTSERKADANYISQRAQQILSETNCTLDEAYDQAMLEGLPPTQYDEEP